MDEPLRNLTGPETVGLVAIIMGSICVTLVAAVGILIPNWTSAKKTAAEFQLKRDMIAAGYSADDIERVIQTTVPSPTERIIRANNGGNTSRTATSRCG